MLNLNKILLITLFSFFVANSIQANKIDLSDSERLYRRAKSFESSGKYSDAEDLYNQVFIHSPDNEKYYNALKKILIKNEDCIALIDNVELFCNAKGNTEYSKINKLEVLMICNGEWEYLFQNLLNNNLKDLKFLTKLIGNIIVNDEETLAINSINQIRDFHNDDSFFSNELGYYYMALQKYPESLSEFLNYLKKYPKYVIKINERIMSFPNDDSDTNQKMFRILENSEIIESKIILADIYFKTRNFLKSIETLKKHNLDGQLLSLAINLNQLNQFDTAHELFIYIIENSNDKVAQKAVFELAKSLEKRGLIEKPILPLSGFMNENDFFSSPFIKINETESILMHKAISLYDSLSMNNRNLDAEFRLSEIRFKALGDLDSAYELYTEIYQTTRNRDMKLRTITRIVDVNMAKGDLNSALDIINDELESVLWKDDEKIKLQVKQNQILFYQNQIETVFNNLNLISKRYSVQDDGYNDIIEVMRVLILLKNDSEISKRYTEAQLKIHQNKRTEAINILDSIGRDCEDELLRNLISYQTANLLILQNRPQEALTKLESISGDDIYNELSQILIAEIYDYMLNNSQQATIYYMSILENFKRSIHYESVRLRLEKIYLDSTL